MYASIAEYLLIKNYIVLMNWKQTKGITSCTQKHVELTPADLSSLLTSCKEMGLSLEDFETTFQHVIDRMIEGTDDRSPSRDLKILFKFLQQVSFYFKGMIKINEGTI